MNIGDYTFQEFKDKAADFHGYPAPGLLVGGYMVAMAKKALPERTLFEAVVETKKCLPDAVQLLSLCSIGNNWMKVINLGRYAVSLFDKFTGIGVRVHIDVSKLDKYPEIRAWLLKEKPKCEQDTERLFYEIETAGDTICTMVPIRIRSRLLGHYNMGIISVCPRCGEAFPQGDGVICRGCQGEAPYSSLQSPEVLEPRKPKAVPVEEAVGKKALHDMTQIIPGEYKGAAFAAGQTIEAGDVCRLQQMGRFSLAVEDDTASDSVHENAAAQAFAERMAGTGIHYDLPPREGKIGFTAASAGLFSLDVQRLTAFNMVPEVMCATRQDGAMVDAGTAVAATRIIPLYISHSRMAEALATLSKPLFSVLPFRKAKVGILVTGTEVFRGLIEDKFIPIITAKVEQYSCHVVKATIVPDEKDAILQAIAAIRAAGADLLITTGGLSVDPDDITRSSLIEAGLTDVLHGAPVLPGSMSLVGRMPSLEALKNGQVTPRDLQGYVDHAAVDHPVAGEMQVVGVPACALYFKTTLFDALLPRLLAGRPITRPELAAMGQGGFCMNCKVCAWPKCPFLK